MFHREKGKKLQDTVQLIDGKLIKFLTTFYLGWTSEKDQFCADQHDSLWTYILKQKKDLRTALKSNFSALTVFVRFCSNHT